MKKLSLLLTVVAIFSLGKLAAQTVPQGINYQCVVRDSTGEPAKNETVNLLLSIRLEVPNGAVEYAEKHEAVTNDFGLVNLVVGQGEAQTANPFSNINWGSGAKFLTVALESAPNEPLGSVRLVSVPYALYAQRALETESGDDWGDQTVVVGATLQGDGAANPLEIKPNSINSFHLTDGSIQAADLAPGAIPGDQTLSLNGDTLTISGAGGNSILLPEGLVYVPGAGIGIAGNVIFNLGDPNPNDDLTSGSGAGGDLSGALPNPTVDGLQNRPVSNVAPGVNQVLKWDGSQWKPAADEGGNGNPIGPAGGDLSGTYPNPNIASDAVGSAEILNASITNADIAPGTSLPPSGAASGDLTGTYPSPTVAANAIGSAEIQDGSLTQADFSPGVSFPLSGTAGGDLMGTYPNPSVAPSAVGSAEILDGSIGNVDFAPGATLPPSGAAGGDLTGNYPNPLIAQNAVGTNEIANGSITNADFAPSATLPPSGAAGGGLTGLYPNPTIAADAISSSEIINGSLTNADFAPGVTFPPSGAANGDLSGNYPSPTVDGLQNRPVSAAAPSTDQVLKWNGSQWQPADDATGGGTGGGSNPTGSAGGDLGGSYPNPIVDGLQNRPLSNAAPSANQVLKWSGTQWEPAADTGGSPTGNAGGDLNGTYPNPTVDALQNRPVSDAAPNLNQVLKWDGSEWKPAADGGGSPTGSAGGDLAGAYPNPTVDGLQNRPVSNSLPSLHQVLKWNGVQWEPGDDNAGTSTGSAGGDLNGTYPNPTVDGLQNRPVSNAAPSANQVLKWNGTQWEPATDTGGNPTGSAGGDLNGTYPSPTVDGLQNRPVSNAAPNIDQVLKWDGSQWRPGDVTGGTGGGNPTGSAGGDLSGNYPNPTVDGLQTRPVSAVAPGVNEVLKWDGAQWEPATDGAGGTAHGDLSGSYPAPVVDGLQNRPLSATAPGLNQVLKWNGAQWEPADDATVGGGGSAWANCNPGGTKIAFDTNPAGANSAGIGTCPPDDSTRLDIVTTALPIGIRIKAGQPASLGAYRSIFATTKSAAAIGAEIHAFGTQSSEGIVLRSQLTSGTGASRGMDISVKNGNTVKGIDLKAENGLLATDGAIVFANSTTTSNGVKIAVNSGQDATGMRIFSGVNSTSLIEEDLNADQQNYGIYLDLKDRQGAVRSPIQVATDVGLYVTADDVATDYAAFFDGDVGIPHELEFLDPVNGNQWAMLIEKGATANCSGQTNHSDDDLLFTYNGSLRVLFRAFDGVPCYGSDRRLKENFTALTPVLSQVLTLNPQFYNLKKDPQKTRTVGFIAQEVQTLFPELVHPVEDENGEEILTLNYDGFTVLAVKAIQEQQTIIEAQKTELEKQQARLDAVEKEMEEIKRLLRSR